MKDHKKIPSFGQTNINEQSVVANQVIELLKGQTTHKYFLHQERFCVGKKPLLKSTTITFKMAL
jgi:hypothetical protein